MILLGDNNSLTAEQSLCIVPAPLIIYTTSATIEFFVIIAKYQLHIEEIFRPDLHGYRIIQDLSSTKFTAYYRI